MKQLIIILFAALMSAGCRESLKTSQSREPLPDISDLNMVADLQQVFSERRERLLGKIGNGIVVLRSDYENTGGRHEYRAAGNFYYLTGFNQPASMILLSKDGSYPFSLYVKEKTISEAVYTGEVPLPADIMKIYQPDTVLYYKNIVQTVKEAIRTGTPVYIDYADTYLENIISNSSGSPQSGGNMLCDVTPLINEMRVIKGPIEASRIQKAADITGEAFMNACRLCKPGMYEFEVEAMIEYTFRKNGSSMPAFESIVGSGANAVSLHYSANIRKMENGDLLLMDIGAEYGFYCADITRTIPVNGKFSREQKEIYQLVLESQKAAIEEMQTGKPLVSGHNKSTRIIVNGLYKLGLITDTTREWQRRFYFHYPISHYLGMDVHDVGDYGEPFFSYRENIVKDTVFGRMLEKGMVLTVEPGLYFRSNAMSQLYELFGNEADREEISDFIKKVSPVYEKYKNIGVRIEDDILITENGNINLSRNIPKEIDEIEKIMSMGNR